MVSDRAVDELLEEVWLADEAGTPARREAIEVDVGDANLDEVIAAAVERGLVAEKDGVLALTGDGHEAARALLRRHRLAERLMIDVLEMRPDAVETNACRFEHMLSEEVMRAICTLLGHPTTCPHGNAIPPGPCCTEKEAAVEQVVLPLTQLQPHQRAKVVYIATGRHARLDVLSSLGLVPGVEIRLHQRRPSYILFVGETNLAIDDRVAGDIFVRPLDPPVLHAPGHGQGAQARRRRGWFRQ